MKLYELFNNYPKHYINVLPPSDVKPTGSMIATIMRARANEQGNEDTEYESRAESSKLWPNDKYGYHKAREIRHLSRMRLKNSRNAEWEHEVISDKNRHAKDEGIGATFR